jgi:hypothetical protein
MVCLQQSAVGKRLQNVGSRSNVQGCACMVCKTCTCMATPHRPAHPQPAAGPWIRCRMPTTASTLAFHIHPPTPRFRLADPGLWPCCRFTVPRHLLHDSSFSSNPSLPPSLLPPSPTDSHTQYPPQSRMASSPAVQCTCNCAPTMLQAYHAQLLHASSSSSTLPLPSCRSATLHPGQLLPHPLTHGLILMSACTPPARRSLTTSTRCHSCRSAQPPRAAGSCSSASTVGPA